MSTRPSYPQRHRVRDRVADAEAHSPSGHVSVHGDKVFSIPRAYYDDVGDRHTVGSINHVLPTPSRRKKTEPSVSTERLVVPPPNDEEQTRVASYFQFLNEQEGAVDLHEQLRETRSSRVASQPLDLPPYEMDESPLARRCAAALAACALLAVGVAIATDGVYVVVEKYDNANDSRPWDHPPISSVGVAYGTVETGVLLALAAFVSIVGVISRSEGVFFSHVLIAIVALIRAVDALLAQSRLVVVTDTTDWMRVGLIVAATILTLALVTVTLYFAFYAILRSRDEEEMRARPLVIAGACLALLLIPTLLASTSLVAFVHAYNDNDAVVRPLSLHHVILAALLLLWALTVLGGGVSASRPLLLACAVLYVPLAYRMTTSYGDSLKLGWRVSTDEAVSDSWYYYVMLASGLIVNVYCTCLLPLIAHAAL